jgi:hypothetical protein
VSDLLLLSVLASQLLHEGLGFYVPYLSDLNSPGTKYRVSPEGEVIKDEKTNQVG